MEHTHFILNQFLEQMMSDDCKEEVKEEHSERYHRGTCKCITYSFRGVGVNLLGTRRRQQNDERCGENISYDDTINVMNTRDLPNNTASECTKGMAVPRPWMKKWIREGISDIEITHVL